MPLVEVNHFSSQFFILVDVPCTRTVWPRQHTLALTPAQHQQQLHSASYYGIVRIISPALLTTSILPHGQHTATTARCSTAPSSPLPPPLPLFVGDGVWWQGVDRSVERGGGGQEETAHTSMHAVIVVVVVGAVVLGPCGDKNMHTRVCG